jgi:pimeloyl-ACP methyl ester carboxylesterase
MKSVWKFVVLVLAAFLVAGCASDEAEPEPIAEVDETPAIPTPTPPPPMKTVDLGGAEVAYLDRGTGDTAVVLVHGWASDHRVWYEQVDVLAADRRVLAMDLPGHGQSGEPTEPYGMDLFAAGIAAVMDDAGVERATLIGHSNGVPAVRQFYRKYPERTASLVFVDGALRKMFDDSMVEGFLAQFQSDEYSGHVATIVDSMPPYELTDEEREEIRAIALAQPQHAIVGGMTAALDASIWGEDPIEVPLLVVLAAQPAWTHEYEAFVRELVPEVEYVVRVQVSHFLMIERPDRFNETVTEFLAKHGL